MGLPADQQLMVLAELGDRGGLAGRGWAGDDQAAAGAHLVAVEQDQPPAGVGDLSDRRGGDHDQPGMMVQPRLVVGFPCLVVQALPRLPAERGRQGGGVLHGQAHG
jgi:hypothetical protein